METEAAFLFFLIFPPFLFSEDFTWPGTIIHIFFTVTKDCWNRVPVGKQIFFWALPGWALWCCKLLCTSQLLEKVGSGGHQTELPVFLHKFQQEIVMLAFQRVGGGEPQELFLSSEQVHFAKAISNLSTTGRKRREERGWKGRRRNRALLISRVHALEVEGRSLKLNIRERNQQATKSSGRECPLSSSDGIAKKDCCHGPLPHLFSTGKGAWELNNAH